MAFKMKGSYLYGKNPLKQKEDFKPHNMYDRQKAETYNEHVDLKEKGYKHSPYKRCWDGYKPNPDGRPAKEKGSCVPDSSPNKKRGLWDNIHAKRKRGEKMRSKGDKGAPTEKAIKDSQSPAKAKNCGCGQSPCKTHGSPAKQTNKRTKGEGRHFRKPEEGAGMTAAGVASYKKQNPGSKLQTAVTGKVKPGSKDAGRRKSFCARSKSWTGERGKAARARWKC